MGNFDQVYKNLIENDYCFGTGIWTAVNSNICMKLNKYGAYIPYLKDKNIDISVEECRLLKGITPFYPGNLSEQNLAKEIFSKSSDIKYNKKLGYYQHLYIGHVGDKSFRMNSSSGGIVTWILTELMNKGKIDAVIQVKHTKNDPNDILFKYGISETVNEIFQNAKTRYYPVEMSEVLEYVKSHPGKYAIVGLPSYVYAIRLLQKNEPLFKERIKYCIGLICGHQKTTAFADYLAWQCGIKPGKLANINFRRKIPNQKASSYGIELWEKGKPNSITAQMKDLKGGNWGQGYFKLKASDFTDDVMNETADVTLGDAWLDNYTSDYKGNNVLVVRNQDIDELILSAEKAGRLSLNHVDENEIIKSQRSHFRHTQDELSYRVEKVEKKGEWHPQLNINLHDVKRMPFMRKKIQDQRAAIRDSSHKQFLKAKIDGNLEEFDKAMNPLCRKYSRLYRIYNIQRGGVKEFFIKLKNKITN